VNSVLTTATPHWMTKGTALYTLACHRGSLGFNRKLLHVRFEV